MGTDQILLVESCIGQVEVCGGRFSEYFAREIELVSSVCPAAAPESIQIDPLQFLLSARNHLRHLEHGDPVFVSSLLPQDEHFNVTANAMLRALAKTLGPKLDADSRQVWIEAFRRIAQNSCLRARPGVCPERA